MGLGDRVVSRIVGFFRAGYPDWAPKTGYIPLLALLPRRVSDDEIASIAAKLLLRDRRPIDNADIGVEISRATSQLPSLNDVERVQQRLAAAGWSDKPPRV
ncbi:hypothetical protein MNAB215_389 [Mycobacterium numidiamassiliense]|jgi:hypothetical protein|uniref:DUF3349 domain-containing protein n=1 Tax=Mycobacterium numidiamassiliense TaxID=1841861 RepID=A0A2U3P369_9MYCO|nr:DUF3349 domain-containing protein [Mycobacterium numidiamassiliense]SPM38213.1 hypothetical protein MNAB215_389 [Mycobacterium numidiamassiliense]